MAPHTNGLMTARTVTTACNIWCRLEVVCGSIGISIGHGAQINSFYNLPSYRCRNSLAVPFGSRRQHWPDCLHPKQRQAWPSWSQLEIENEVGPYDLDSRRI